MYVFKKIYLFNLYKHKLNVKRFESKITQQNIKLEELNIIYDNNRKTILKEISYLKNGRDFQLKHLNNFLNQKEQEDTTFKRETVLSDSSDLEILD